MVLIVDDIRAKFMICSFGSYCCTLSKLAIFVPSLNVTILVVLGHIF